MASPPADSAPAPFSDAPSRPVPETAPGPLDEALNLEGDAPRWIGWRLRLLAFAVLVGCVGIFILAYWVAAQPHLDARWRVTSTGQVQLTGSDNPVLRAYEGRTLIAVGSGSAGRRVAVDLNVLQHSSRWIADDAARQQHMQAHDALSRVVPSKAAGNSIELTFDQTYPVSVDLQPRGFGSLPPVFWLLCALSLVLYLVAMAVILAGPSLLNWAYAVMALSQCGNLLFIALEASLGISVPATFPRWDWQARSAFDLVTSACMVQIAALHPHRLRGHWFWALGGWAVALGLVAASSIADLPHVWWMVQAGCTLLGATAIGLVTWSNRAGPHPFSLVLRRFGVITLGTWLLLTAAVVMSTDRLDLQQSIATVGSMIWYVFLASLLLLVPYLSRSQQILREFSLLAATSTVATSLDLLFVAVFSLGQFASMTLSLFLALGAYLAARQWIVSHLLGSSRLTMERLFERLYRMARELETQPQRVGELLARLLRELFEPLEVLPLKHGVSMSRTVGNGSGLIVPVPRLRREDMPDEPAALLVRHARKGQRLFTSEDARLTDRIIDQLRRAVAFDQAVEQGRSEERTRIAQDLHDDIGARLLTLMYQAPSADIEDYIRHTIQDLKTLTRGLAAQSHRLSDAAGEWKADLSQRLALAHCDLEWHIQFDEDIELGMVQWSALTRVLRELVSNAIAHAKASRVSVTIQLQQDRLDLSVRDNGGGNSPETWPHGLGLGGVRKRVKQLGGTVEWLANTPRGIECRVRVPHLIRPPM